MTAEQINFLQSNWLPLAALVGAVYLMFFRGGGGASSPLAGFKFPAIPVRIVKDDTRPGS